MFLVLDGSLVTPPLESGCLAGITRELVVAWCDVEERTVAAADLLSAQEVFLTSSTRDVHAVHRVDRHPRAAPGPVTSACRARFAQESAADLNP